MDGCDAARHAEELLSRSFTILPFSAGSAAARAAADALFDGDFEANARALNGPFPGAAPGDGADAIEDTDIDLSRRGAFGLHHRPYSDPAREVVDVHLPFPVPHPGDSDGDAAITAVVRLAAACDAAAHCLLRAVLTCVDADRGCTAHDGVVAALEEHSRGSLRSSASLLRLCRYRATAPVGLPPHLDHGLITVAPRANVPALRVWDRAAGGWVAVEEAMREGDAIALAGQQLAVLTGGAAAACVHDVPAACGGGGRRVSSPFLLRMPHGAALSEMMRADRPAVPVAAVSAATDAVNRLGEEEQAGAAPLVGRVQRHPLCGYACPAETGAGGAEAPLPPPSQKMPDQLAVCWWDLDDC